jgi:hypothetical protein
MVSQYMKKNIYTSLLSISILGLMIAALATPWYIWDNTFSEQSFDQTLNPSSGMTTVATSATLNQTTILYDLIGFRSIRQISGSKAKAQSYKAHTLAEMPSVTAIFRVSTSFVLITLILSLAISVFQLIFLNDYIRNKILYLVGMSNFRIALIAASVVTVISTIIALLALLGVSTAFKLDQPVCTEGPCRDFSSSVTSVFDNGAVKTVTRWGPDAGWYITLAAVPFSIILLYFVVSNRFPLPAIYDGGPSGEAL